MQASSNHGNDSNSPSIQAPGTEVCDMSATCSKFPDNAVPGDDVISLQDKDEVTVPAEKDVESGNIENGLNDVSDTVAEINANDVLEVEKSNEDYLSSETGDIKEITNNEIKNENNSNFNCNIVNHKAVNEICSETIDEEVD